MKLLLAGLGMLAGLGVLVLAVLARDPPNPPPSPPSAPRLDSGGEFVGTTTDSIRNLVAATRPGQQLEFVRVHASDRDRYRVSVRFDAEDNATDHRRAAIERDLWEVYKALYTSRFAPRIRGVRIEARASLADKYGSRDMAAALTTVLGGAEGRRVDWNDRVPAHRPAWTEVFARGDL
jgi:hypothetical protein